jgi:uncharacterized protein YecE (DUF72 family)
MKSKIQNPKSKIKIGCQGWNYADWTTKAGGEKIFYPRGTKSNEMLAVYAEAFESVEVDSTFYAIPAETAVENWYKRTPENFTFSLKLPQEITHEHSLRETSFPVLEEFCERVLLLKEKLGVVLIQMPPQFEASKENALALRNFLPRLPRAIRFAVEFRHRDWLIEWTFEELEKNSATLCLVEGGWIPREMMFQSIEKLAVNFAYVRFMGERDLTTFDRVARPQDAGLQIWREELEKLKAKEIFIYFSNFYEGFAPASANKMRALFGQKTVAAAELEDQGSLF